MTKNAEKMFGFLLFCSRSRGELLINVNFVLFHMNIDPYFW